MSPVRWMGTATLVACVAVAAMLSGCAADPPPSPTPTLTPTPEAIASPTAAAPLAPGPAATPTSAPAPTATPEPTAAPTSTPRPAPLPTPTPASAPAPAPGPTPTPGGDGAASRATLVMLADPLDEPEFYCVDVAGFGASLGLDRPLQAHTCKPGADDEMFAFGRPAEGQIYLVEHDRCLEADGTSLYVRSCSGSPLQRFAYGDDGALSPGEGELCLAVAGGDGEPAGGRSHVRRDLLLQPCGEADPMLSRWVFPGPSPSG